MSYAEYVGKTETQTDTVWPLLIRGLAAMLDIPRDELAPGVAPVGEEHEALAVAVRIAAAQHDRAFVHSRRGETHVRVAGQQVDPQRVELGPAA